MKRFLSCDWGTSVLRLRLVDADNSQVLTEAVSTRGVLSVFNEWKNNGAEAGTRLTFFLDVLADQIKKIEQQLSISPEEIPLIISGMASSGIGLMELPYKKIPYAITEELIIENIPSTNTFRYPVLLISGIKSDEDVIRGEETQLLGSAGENTGSQLFIFPGTHSKHILVRHGVVIEIKTFMTGEFFELLSKKSILASSVVENGELMNADNINSFQAGVRESKQSNLLHGSFKIRTNDLFQKLSKQQNYFFLSGLVVGSELKDLVHISESITVVANKMQMELYKAALDCLGIYSVNFQDSTTAVLCGHEKVYSRVDRFSNTGRQKLQNGL